MLASLVLTVSYPGGISRWNKVQLVNTSVKSVVATESLFHAPVC